MAKDKQMMDEGNDTAPAEGDMMSEESVTEEEIPVEEEAVPGDISSLKITTNELPSLSSLNVGDTITLTIKSISPEGAYELVEEMAPEGEAGSMSGRQAIVQALG